MKIFIKIIFTISLILLIAFSCKKEPGYESNYLANVR